MFARMPRYYFHYRDPQEHLTEDWVGSPHATFESVQREAELLAKEILSEEVEQGCSPSLPRCLEVEDEAGEIVLFLPFWANVLAGAEQGVSD